MRSLNELKQDFINLVITPTAWLGDSPDRFDTCIKPNKLELVNNKLSAIWVDRPELE